MLGKPCPVRKSFHKNLSLIIRWVIYRQIIFEFFGCTFVRSWWENGSHHEFPSFTTNDPFWPYDVQHCYISNQTGRNESRKDPVTSPEIRIFSVVKQIGSVQNLVFRMVNTFYSVIKIPISSNFGNNFTRKWFNYEIVDRGETVPSNDACK
jgi:hypothetical protein